MASRRACANPTGDGSFLHFHRALHVGLHHLGQPAKAARHLIAREGNAARNLRHRAAHERAYLLDGRFSRGGVLLSPGGWLERDFLTEALRARFDRAQLSHRRFVVGDGRHPLAFRRREGPSMPASAAAALSASAAPPPRPAAPSAADAPGAPPPAPPPPASAAMVVALAVTSAGAAAPSPPPASVNEAAVRSPPSATVASARQVSVPSSHASKVTLASALASPGGGLDVGSSVSSGGGWDLTL